MAEVERTGAHDNSDERKAQRERPEREQDGDPPHFVCRVCGHQDIQKAYCPECLADTMEASAAPRAR